MATFAQLHPVLATDKEPKNYTKRKQITESLKDQFITPDSAVELLMPYRLLAQRKRRSWIIAARTRFTK